MKLVCPLLLAYCAPELNPGLLILAGLVAFTYAMHRRHLATTTPEERERDFWEGPTA